MKELEFLFIEFGRFPKHVTQNIHRLHRLFPSIPITLLTDIPKKARSVSRECKVIEWTSESYKTLHRLKNYQDSKDKFWLYTTSRLFALCDFHINHHRGPILHIESDVLLASNFPIQPFLKSSKLMWGRYNHQRDVAALLYSPSAVLSEQLLLHMKHEVIQDSAHTDMSLLSVVAKKLGENHAYLPSFPSSDSPLVNQRSKITDQERQTDSALYTEFDGIFDHQVIGMWLDGLDPKHTYGLRKNLFSASVYSGESFVDPTAVEYQLDSPFELKMRDGLQTLNLYSIHLHSKSLLWFKLDSIAKLTAFLERVNLHIPHMKMDFVVLYNLIRQNIRQRTFLLWLRHLMGNTICRVKSKHGRRSLNQQ